MRDASRLGILGRALRDPAAAELSYRARGTSRDAGVVRAWLPFGQKQQRRRQQTRTWETLPLPDRTNRVYTVSGSVKSASWLRALLTRRETA
jgi:hypothetical protein